MVQFFCVKEKTKDDVKTASSKWFRIFVRLQIEEKTNIPFATGSI